MDDKLIIHIDRILKKRFKVLAAKKNTTMSVLIRQLIEREINKHD